MPSLGRKVQGVHRNQSFNDENLRNIAFESVTFAHCSFVNTLFESCSGTYLSLQDCEVRNPRFHSCAPWDHISLTSTKVENIKDQLEVTAFSHIKDSTLRDVTIRGKRREDSVPLILVNSTLSGELANFTIVENRARDQLVDCDLRHSSLHNIRFLGVPVDRCQLPQKVLSIVVKNWPAIANEILTKALSSFNNPEASKSEKVAASIVISEIQNDAGAFHSAHNTRRKEVKDLNLPSDRGARLVSELLDPTIPSEVSAAIRALYEPWIS